MQIRPPKAPNLAVGPNQYEQRYQNQLNNQLRIYFNELDNFSGYVLSSVGGTTIQYPYGAFQDTTTQTAVANTATLMSFNTTDFSNAVSMVSGSKMTVQYPGIYNLQFSTQFQNTDVQLHDVSIWLRKNGADITGSTGLISVPNSHGGTPGHIIAGWNYFVQLAANDYIQLWWSTDNAAVTIQYYAAQVGPVRPSTASTIATLTFVSAIPA